MAIAPTIPSDPLSTYGNYAATVDYADYALISPAENSVGNDRRTDIVVEFAAALSRTQFPGNTFLYPHVPSLRQAGSNLLKTYPILTATTPTDGFGILYATADDSPTGTVVGIFPCSVDLEPGWGLSEAQASAGRAMRFRLNPYPGGVNNNELPGGKKLFVRLAQTLPSLVISA